MPPLNVEYNQTRPNRIEDKKDEEYHSRFARWTLGGLNHQLHREWIRNCIINWSFFKGGDGQWIKEDDLENFFLDESGDVRNRIKMTKNLIKPMVNQYIGNAVRLNYRARAESSSDFVTNIREQKLSEIDFHHDLRNANPEFSEAMSESFPIQETKEESKEIFENVFQGKYLKDINNLLKWGEKHLKFEELKVRTAKYIALNGVGVYKGYEQNGSYVGEPVDPMFWWFDRSALKPDLSDAEYMGHWYYLDTPTLFEKYQKLTTGERKAIENHTTNNSGNMHKIVDDYYMASNNRIPVYETYWKDMEEQWYGWVNDEFGYPFFARINHADADYTDKDLVEPPKGEASKRTKGKKKAKIFVDVLRYAIFIPREEVGTIDGAAKDILLEWGEVPYQETYRLDPSNVQFPFKAYCWSYDKGEILTPLDDAIDPQRFLNRMISIAESHINNSRGQGTVIAKNAVDPRDGEEAISRNVNKSKTVFLDTTRTGGVQNAVGTYGSDIGASAQQLFGIVKELQLGMQDVTGVNDAMTGSGSTSDSLVGVVEAQIQRGTLIQEPFYYALTSVLGQAYQHLATVGKKIYADNPLRLAVITGDGGAERINITKEMRMEDFRTFIERSVPEETLIEKGNNMIISLLQLGMLDDKTAANLFNRSTPEDIANGMRTSINLKEMAKNQKAQQDIINQAGAAEAAAEGIRVGEAKQDAANITKLEESEKDRGAKIDEIMARGAMQIERDNNKEKGNPQQLQKILEEQL